MKMEKGTEENDDGKKRSVLLRMARVVVYFLAYIGGIFWVSFFLFWWFGPRECMKDCLANGHDEVTCEVEICDD